LFSAFVGAAIHGKNFLTIVTNWLQVGNTLQRTPDGYNYRTDLGNPGYVYWYTKPQVDSLLSATSLVESYNDLTAKTAPIANVISYTPLVIGTYRVGVYLNVISINTTTSIGVEITYTDENNLFKTINLYSQGATSPFVSYPGNYAFPLFDIRCKAGSPITVLTVQGTYTAPYSYDVGGTITKIR